MRRFVRLSLLCSCLQVCLLLVLAAPAHAERRVALVIGNGAYKAGPLKNPVNDARDMAASLKGLGFEVILRENAGLAQMEQAVDQFWISLKKGGVGLFFFAGHGLQVKGVNYLVPVDANIQVEQDVKVRCLDVNLVLGRMEDAGNPLNLVILDACRNNPFARAWRNAGQGLAKMDAPTGTLIAYATAPDSVAADGVGKNGVYTSHLLRFMHTPGLTIENVLKQTRVAVLNETGRKQIPWEASSLTGDFFFSGPSPASAAPPLAVLPLPTVSAPQQPASATRPNTQPGQDLAAGLVGRYAVILPETGASGLNFEFSLQNGRLVATTSGWTGGVTPIEVGNVRIEGSTLRFRFTYKQGLFGLGGTTYTDYSCDLSGGLDSLPVTYVTAKGNRGREVFLRQTDHQAVPPAVPPAAQDVARPEQDLAHRLVGSYRWVVNDGAEEYGRFVFALSGNSLSGYAAGFMLTSPAKRTALENLQLDDSRLSFQVPHAGTFQFTANIYSFGCDLSSGVETIPVVELSTPPLKKRISSSRLVRLP
jgi:hypothetical protein